MRGSCAPFLPAYSSPAASEPDGPILVRSFLAEHADGWIDLLAQLLTLSDSPYLMLVGEGLAELAEELRSAFPAAEPADAAAS